MQLHKFPSKSGRGQYVEKEAKKKKQEKKSEKLSNGEIPKVNGDFNFTLKLSSRQCSVIC